MTESPKRERPASPKPKRERPASPKPKRERPASPKLKRGKNVEKSPTGDAHVYTNSNGKEFTLYMTVGKNNNTLYFYSAKTPSSGTPTARPERFTTKEAPNSCMPLLARIA